MRPYSFLLLIIVFSSYGQSFEKVLIEDFFYMPTEIIELKNGYVISASIGKTSTNELTASLLKINKNGNLLKKIDLGSSNKQFQTNLLRVNDTLILLVSYVQQTINDTLTIQYFLLTDELNLVKTESFETFYKNRNYFPVVYSRVCKFTDDNILHVLGIYSWFETNQRGVYIISLDSSLKFRNVQISYNTDITNVIPESTCQIPNTDTALIFFSSKVYKYSNETIVDSFPQSFYNYVHSSGVYAMGPPFSTEWYSGNLYIGGGNDYKICRFNSNYSIDKFNLLEIGEDICTAHFRPMSQKNGTFYLCGTNNCQSLYYGQESHLKLYRLNQELDTIWVKTYNQEDNFFYHPWYSLATSDGGCLIAATRNHYPTLGEKLDLYLLKVDSLGNYTPMVGLENPTTTTQPLVYPNPGTSTLTIETAEGTAGSTFRMYNSTGMLMLQQTLQTEKQNIDVSSLPAGMYIYETQGRNGMVERGKWVKMD